MLFQENNSWTIFNDIAQRDEAFITGYFINARYFHVLPAWICVSTGTCVSVATILS